jgi:hypothetical protein
MQFIRSIDQLIHTYICGLPNERGLNKTAHTRIKAPLGQPRGNEGIERFSRARSGAQNKVEICSYFQCQLAWQSHIEHARNRHNQTRRLRLPQKSTYFHVAYQTI